MMTKAQTGGGKAGGQLILQQCEDFLQTGDVAPLLQPRTERRRWRDSQSRPRPDALAAAAADGRPRTRARNGAWYEMVPRSQGKVPGEHGTFRDCIARLPDVAGDGLRRAVFHADPSDRRDQPQGPQQRAEGRAGRSRQPLCDRRRGRRPRRASIPSSARSRISARWSRRCKAHDMEVALDFAVQCSPDHPWLKQHPDWFKRRPDGSMKYAENPPKKYEDIVNPDFACDDAGSLWNALRDVFLFWVDQGVKIFRIDNPHTKPLPFWEWLIHEVQLRIPTCCSSRRPSRGRS